MSRKKKAKRAFAKVPSFKKLCKKIALVQIEYPDVALVAHRRETAGIENQPYYLSINGIYLEKIDAALELPRMEEEIATVAWELTHGCYRGPYLKGLETWSRAALEVMEQQCKIHDLQTAESLRKNNSLN